MRRVLSRVPVLSATVRAWTQHIGNGSFSYIRLKRNVETGYRLHRPMTSKRYDGWMDGEPCTLGSIVPYHMRGLMCWGLRPGVCPVITPNTCMQQLPVSNSYSFPSHESSCQRYSNVMTLWSSLYCTSLAAKSVYTVPQKTRRLIFYYNFYHNKPILKILSLSNC